MYVWKMVCEHMAIRNIKNIMYSENTQQCYSKTTAQNSVYATHVEIWGMVELCPD